MAHRVLYHLRGNIVGYVALFIALGGTGYAATALPRGSVGTAQLRNGAVTQAKLNGKQIGGSVRAWAYVSAAGHEYAGRGFKVVAHFRPLSPEYALKATNRDLRSCAASASVVTDNHVGGPDVGFASALLPPITAGRKNSFINVRTFAPSGQAEPLPFVVEILC